MVVVATLPGFFSQHIYKCVCMWLIGSQPSYHNQSVSINEITPIYFRFFRPSIRPLPFLPPETEVRDVFRKWREDNERKSDDIVQLWETVLHDRVQKLGNERHLVLEQVIIAALDCGRIEVADECIGQLSAEFPGSLRVQKYCAMRLEAMEMYDEALKVLEDIIGKDETNAAPRKRKIAILKAKGKPVEAIKELCEYLKK